MKKGTRSTDKWGVKRFLLAIVVCIVLGAVGFVGNRAYQAKYAKSDLQQPLVFSACTVNSPEVIRKGQSGFDDDIILKTEDGSRTARSVYEDINGYANYNKLFIDGKLVADNLTTSYENFGLLPLYWSLDNKNLYLLTKDIANHGYQESTEIYKYNTDTDQITLLLSLPSNATSIIKTCGSTEYLLIATSVGGGFDVFDPPHKIILVNLKTEKTKTLYENASGQVNQIRDLKLNPTLNEVNFIEDTYSKDYKVLGEIPSDEKPEPITHTVALSE